MSAYFPAHLAGHIGRYIDCAAVKLLLEKGADVESTDGYGRTPLSWAAAKGDEAVMKLNVEAQIARVDCHTRRSLPTNNLSLLPHSLRLDAPPQDQ
jgi:ankyrin repeat protein